MKHSGAIMPKLALTLFVFAAASRTTPLAEQARVNALVQRSFEGKSKLFVQGDETAQPETFFVAPVPDGDSRSAVQECADKLKASTVPHSSCKLRPGTYYFSGPVVLEGFNDGVPRHITAEDPDDPPSIVGTTDITNYKWKLAQNVKNCNRCYYTKYEAENPPWQLFLGDDMLVNARWPNAKWSDNSLFDSEKTWAHASNGSTYLGLSKLCAKEPLPGQKCPAGYELATPEQSAVPAPVCQSTDIIECNAGKKKGHVPTLGGGTSTMIDGTNPPPEYRSKPLADENVNVTGAVAVLNIGSWLTYTGTVKSHTTGSASFTYESKPGWNVAKFTWDSAIYYLESHLDLLDAEGEWFYDKQTKNIFAKFPGGVHPSRLTSSILARTQTYAFKVHDSRNLTLSKLSFFATTIFSAARDKHEVMEGHTWDSLTFKYPSMPKYMLKDVTSIAPTTMRSHGSSAGAATWNTIKNCKFLNGVGPVVDFSLNPGLTYENNFISHIHWTGALGVPEAQRPDSKCADDANLAVWCFAKGGVSFPAGSVDAPTRFVRNTLRLIGSQTGIAVLSNNNYLRGKRRTIIEMNRISELRALQVDGGIYSGGAEGIVLNKNWMYDSVNARHHGTKWGLRFDRGQSSCGADKWYKRGAITRNVVFRTAGISLKGNEHTLAQNTVFKTGKGLEDDPNAKATTRDLNIYGSHLYGTCQCSRQDCKRQADTCCNGEAESEENSLSTVLGNLMDSYEDTLGGVSFKVSTALVDKQIQDVGVPSVSFNSAGVELTQRLRDPLNFDFRPRPGSVEEKQCIGAYGSDRAEYWVPGHQEERATFPIPPTGSVTLRHDGSLAFNPARGAEKHIVVVSTHADVPSQGSFTSELLAPSNIIPVPADYANPGQQYHWRVDAVFTGGERRVGAIWTYQVKAPEPVDSAPSLCVNVTGAQQADSDDFIFESDVRVPFRFQLQNTSVCFHARSNQEVFQFEEVDGKLKKLEMFFTVGDNEPIYSDRLAQVHSPRMVRDGLGEIRGCFVDGAAGVLEATTASSSTQWKPIFAIGGITGGGHVGKYKLVINGFSQGTQQVSASLRFCFDNMPDQPLPEDNGACAEHPY